MEVTVKATKMTKKSISFIVFAGLSLLTLAAFVKTVFVSIDIDESYAVTQAFRLTKGDRLLRDMWEPHQFSAYLSSLFVSLYLFLFQSTEGIVVFLRLCGTVLHLLLGAALYRTFRGLASAHISLPLCLLHLNFLAKWIQTPEFELMHYWLLTVTLIAFLRFYLNGGKRRWLFLSGLCMTLQLFNYPTLILLYPFYIAGILALPGIRKKKLQNIGIVTLGAAFPGISLLLYLLSYMTPESLIANLSYVLADPSHTGNGLVPRLGAFGLEFLKDLLLLAVLFLLCLLSVYLLRKIPPHKNTPPPIPSHVHPGRNGGDHIALQFPDFGLPFLRPKPVFPTEPLSVRCAFGTFPVSFGERALPEKETFVLVCYGSRHPLHPCRRSAD